MELCNLHYFLYITNFVSYHCNPLILPIIPTQPLCYALLAKRTRRSIDQVQPFRMREKQLLNGYISTWTAAFFPAKRWLWMAIGIQFGMEWRTVNRDRNRRMPPCLGFRRNAADQTSPKIRAKKKEITAHSPAI